VVRGSAADSSSSGLIIDLKVFERPLTFRSAFSSSRSSSKGKADEVPGRFQVELNRDARNVCLETGPKRAVRDQECEQDQGRRKRPDAV
jgi:hypothetical protein